MKFLLGISLVASFVLSGFQAYGFDSGIWGRHFAGNPRVPMTIEDLVSLLKNREPRCEADIQKVTQYALEFHKKAFDNAWYKKNEGYMDAVALLNSLSSSNDDCFQSVAAAYTVASMDVFNRGRVDSNDLGVFSSVGSHYFILKDGTPAAFDMTLALYVASLINNGRVIFLKTPSLSKTKSSQIMAGYCCQESRILIQPFLSPLNLAVLMVHELDHFTRDKNYGLKTLEKDFGGAADIDWKRFVLMDETVAISQSIYKFYGLIKGATSYKQLGWGLGGMMSRLEQRGNWQQFTPYGPIANDDFIVKRKGVFERLWKIVNGKDTSSINPVTNRFFYDVFFNELGVDNHQGKESPKISEGLAKVYEIIGKGYFSEASKDFDYRKMANTRYDHSFSGFSSFIDNRALNDLVVMADRVSSKFRVEVQEQDINGKLSPIYEIGYKMEDLLRSLDLLIQLAQTSSPLCERYSKAVTDGKLDGYKGLEIDDSICQGGGSGVKPGGSGVKPGGSGVKPGGTGVKPGGSGVKPCIVPLEDL